MELPIACSLTGQEMALRGAELSGFARAALRDRQPLPGGARLTFDADAEPRLQELIAGERECCPFLRWDVRREGERLLVDLTGPADAQPLIAAMFA